MSDASNMSDAEIRDRLKFTPRWFELGIVDEDWVTSAVRVFRESDDQSDEHYRYGAFMHYLERHPMLSPKQCRDLFDLGANDPDWPMGQSIMIQVLDRRECPAELIAIASSHPRTQKYV